MNKLLVLLSAGLVIGSASIAQQNIDTLHANASKFIMKGDGENALMILKRAEEQQPSNLETHKLIAFTYYNQRDFASALPYAHRLAASNATDFQQVQMAGLVFKALAMYKDAEKLYKQALVRMQNNGILLSEYGELKFLMKEDGEAIKLWEQGIKTDPNIASNYYHASRYYNTKGNILWAILYGEIFVNLESFSEKTSEIKLQVLQDYKRLFQKPLINQKIKYDPFSLAVLETLGKYTKHTYNGVTAESLNNIRNGFLVEWTSKYANQYPFRLFEWYHDQFHNKTFDAYNYWLLSDSPTALRQWALQNKDQFNDFLNLQNSRVFKIPAGQYYPH